MLSYRIGTVNDIRWGFVSSAKTYTHQLLPERTCVFAIGIHPFSMPLFCDI